MFLISSDFLKNVFFLLFIVPPYQANDIQLAMREYI